MLHFNGSQRERNRSKEKIEEFIDLTQQGLEGKSQKRLPREYYGPKHVYVDPDNNRIEYDPDNVPDYVLHNARIGDNTDTSNIDESDFIMKAADQIEPVIGFVSESRNKDYGYPGAESNRQQYQPLPPDPEPGELARLENLNATNVTETSFSSVTGRTTVTRGSLSSITETY